jgi:nucleotide-binding universal stress UspA family protein
MTYDVLVPVDRNTDRTLGQARYVADLPAAVEEVAATVLYVVPPREFGEQVAFDEVEAAVNAADRLESAGVTVERVVDSGDVSGVIVRAIDEYDADEIVMGGRRRSGVAKVLLGSTVHDVAVSTERPVTITGEHGVVDGEGRRLVLPVDRNTDRALGQARYVTDLPGDPGDVRATVLHVFPHQDYRGAPPHEFDDVGAAVAVAEALEEAGVSVERRAVGGEVARTILSTARDVDADGIVTAGRDRSGVQKVLLGSVVQDLMLSAKRPVTLVG